MDKLDLYDVKKEYVHYLQKAEEEYRGFSRVPNMDYPGREQKFLCGIVMQIHNVDYYVSASSYKIKQPDNILIEFPHDTNPIKGSLRFNYMFPIPIEMVERRIISQESNPTRRLFLSKQLNFFNKNKELISKKAEQTYKRVSNGFNPGLVKNSCDFRLLEQKCFEYCLSNNLSCNGLESLKRIFQHEGFVATNTLIAKMNEVNIVTNHVIQNLSELKNRYINQKEVGNREKELLKEIVVELREQEKMGMRTDVKQENNSLKVVSKIIQPGWGE